MNSLVGFVTTVYPVVVEPIDQRANRGIFLIFDDRCVVERPQERASALELREEPPEINIEPERFAGRMQIWSVNKNGNPVGAR